MLRETHVVQLWDRNEKAKTTQYSSPRIIHTKPPQKKRGRDGNKQAMPQRYHVKEGSEREQKKKVRMVQTEGKGIKR